jgi:hypothetical protein
MTMTPLCELAKKYGTDKGGKHYIAGDTCHEYTPIYDRLFGHRRESVTAVLEIGVNYGCSMRMWEEYFPNASIIGLDSNSECLRHSGGRIYVFAADQGNAQSLLNALDVASGCGTHFDLIVDDGSHELAHQILSMDTLLPFLKDDGYYVIEDLAIDCKPELVYDHMPRGYYPLLLRCEPGLGKAMCGCGCGEPETLLAFRRSILGNYMWDKPFSHQELI